MFQKPSKKTDPLLGAWFGLVGKLMSSWIVFIKYHQAVAFLHLKKLWAPHEPDRSVQKKIQHFSDVTLLHILLIL